MKKNKYAASLESVSRRHVNKTLNSFEDESLVKAIEESDRKKHDQLLSSICNIFGVASVGASLIEILNLQNKKNFDRFKKNIDDGYTAWFVHCFHCKMYRSEGTIHPFEYGIYERDQTYGIQDFKKHFTPSAWKALVKMSPKKQFSLSGWYMSERTLSILSKCLHIGTNTIVLAWLQGLFSSPISMDLVEQILLYLKKYCNKEDTYTAAKDVEDHIRMWSELQNLKYKYPTIVKDLGVAISGKWSMRRFADEHSRLSQMKRDCDREQILEKERREKWKKKNFFNIHKFPQLKGTTIAVDGSKLDVKLINNGTDLFDEGSKMRHCIFDYISYMRAGTYFAFSITDSENPRNCCTITFSVQDDYKSGNTIYGTPTLSTNYSEQKKLVIFDQVRGLRNHVLFTFNQQHLVDEMYDLMKTTRFHDYITDLSKRPLAILKHHERRIKRVAGKSNAFFADQARAHTGDFYRDVNNGILSIWGGDYPRFIYRPSTALDTEFQQQMMQALPDGRDFVNNFFYENDPIPRDNSRFLRAGLERFRESLIGGLNNVVNAFGQGVRSALAQPNTVSDYNEQTGNVIQRTVSSHYPRPEVKEKPFLNSDFLKTVSNG